MRVALTHPSRLSNDNEFLSALNSQGSLARYSNVDHGIVGSSLNTMKRLANELVPGGFEGLDGLRKAAISTFVTEPLNETGPGRSSKAALLNKVSRLESSVEMLRGDLLLLTLALDKSLRQGKEYASNAEEHVRIRCNKEQRDLLDMLTLRKTL